jgi:hypothetical protein
MSISRGLIARTAIVDTTPPNTLRALPGAFVLSGEDMTPITGYAMSVGAGAFAFTGNSVTLPDTGWSPSMLPSLFAWYKADAGLYSNAGTTPVTNGGAVQQWNDQSGGGRHLTQATAGKRPIWTTGNILTFTAANDHWMMTATGVPLGASTLSVFVAARMNVGATPNFGRLFNYGSPSGFDYATGSFAVAKESSNPEIAMYGAAGSAQLGGITDGATFFAGFVNNGTTVSVYKNNVFIMNPCTGGALTTGGAFGVSVPLSNAAPDVGSRWDGRICEIILTTAAVSTADRNEIQAYLAARWP